MKADDGTQRNNILALSIPVNVEQQCDAVNHSLCDSNAIQCCCLCLLACCDLHAGLCQSPCNAVGLEFVSSF